MSTTTPALSGSTIRVMRERMPTRLNATIETPSGGRYRWAEEAARAANVASGIQFGTAMPGGFDTAQVTLARDPAVDYRDLDRLSTIRFHGVGGLIAGEFRLESSARTSGDQMQIEPGLEGWRQHLADNTSVNMVFVDRDLSHWQAPSIAEQARLANAGQLPSGSQDTESDPSGNAALSTTISGAWAQAIRSEPWYDAGAGNKIGKVFYKLALDQAVNPADVNWAFQAMITATDPFAAAGGQTPDLRPGPYQGYLIAATPGRYALLIHSYAAAGGVDGQDYKAFWELAVYGDHQLPLYGPDPGGVLSSDVEAFLVAQHAPSLRLSTGVDGTVQPSTFIIPQLAFTDPTTVQDMITQATSYELRDWAVWENRTYFSNARGARGRRWRARSTDCKLQGAGPQAQDLYNGVILTFTDGAGKARYAGPPGSGGDIEDARLVDPDPENPANELAIPKWGPDPPLSIGVSSPDVVVAIGQEWLQAQKQLDHSGQAEHTGYVQDADTGVHYPVWMMRGGDQVSYPDTDPSYRRIVSTGYEDSSTTNTVQLDAPPDTMSALLARYGLEMTNS